MRHGECENMGKHISSEFSVAWRRFYPTFSHSRSARLADGRKRGSATSPVIWSVRITANPAVPFLQPSRETRGETADEKEKQSGT